MNSKLGKWQGAALLATTLLGTSVFILPQMTIKIAGASAIWSWLLLTLCILPIALVFARLAALHPHAGGPANFVELAFGKIAGRAIGLVFLLVVPIGAPAALIMTYHFVDSIFHFNGAMALAIQLSFLLIIYLLNIKGVSVSATIQLSLTIAITLVVVVLLFQYFSQPIAFGTNKYALQTAPIGLPPWQVMPAVLSAAGLAFWSFLGIEAMAHLASDFENPKRDFVPAVIIGTTLVGLLYIGCTFLVVAIPNSESLAMIGVFNQLFGQYGDIIIGILGVAGGLATVNVYTASCCKLIWSFANQGVLPTAYQPQNRHGVAHTALLHLVSVMAAILIISYFFTINLEVLVGICNGVFVMIYLASMLSAMKLLSHKYRLLTSISILVCIVLAASLGWQMCYVMILLCIVTPLLRRQHRRQKSHSPPVADL